MRPRDVWPPPMSSAVSIPGGSVSVPMRVETENFLLSSRRDEDGAIVFELQGELDLFNADVLNEALGASEKLDVPRVIVDLGGLEFIDSSGLRVLMQAES